MTATRPLSHGFKVGVGTVGVAALYEKVLERDFSDLDVHEAVAAWPSRAEVERRVRASHSTPGLDEAAVEESLAKYIDADELRKRLELLRERWLELRDRLRQQLLRADQLRDKLRAADCPIGPAEIGLSEEAFKETYSRAQMIRRRYTILDLTNETGTLGACVEELFTQP